MDQINGKYTTLDYTEPIPDQNSDWTWPAADTFTDDSIARRTLQTCSQLGSQRIRLTRIRPGSSRDVIECDTKVCFLDEAGDYTALSYTWGFPVERCQIVVDGQPRLVTVNLWRFLWQGRQLAEQLFGWLWIDALSIEQSDPWEKLEQVNIISQIFGGARAVVVWLGPAYGNSDLAMKVLKPGLPGSHPCSTSRRFRASPTGPAMLELCERPYWQRLWIYQELEASESIFLLCGSKYVFFESLDSWLFDNTDERVKAKVQALQNSSAGLMLRLIHATMDSSLRAMLDSTYHLRCTDPRDRVYAILNVVSSGHQGIKADYTNTLPTLMNQILKNMHAAEKQRTLLDVATQCSLLEGVFGVRAGSIFSTEQHDALAACPDPLGRLYHAKVGMLPTERLDLVLKDVRAWCERYGHQVVARIVRQQLPGSWDLDGPELELVKYRRNILLRGGSERHLKTIKLCGEMGKVLKSFESICGTWS